MARALAVLALLLALTGCATPTTPAPIGSAPTADTADTGGVIAAPVGVEISAIGASSSLIPLGLDTDGALAVPPLDQPMQAGWYELGVEPGQLGPSVIAGHVQGRDATGAPISGVFARLAELAPGAEVVVQRHGADPLRWRVVTVERFEKSRFPTAAVYGDTTEPELKLITCGGVFDPATRSHSQNIVVTAVLA